MAEDNFFSGRKVRGSVRVQQHDGLRISRLNRTGSLSSGSLNLITINNLSRLDVVGTIRGDTLGTRVRCRITLRFAGTSKACLSGRFLSTYRVSGF